MLINLDYLANRRSIVAGALVAGALLVGCGGDSDDSPAAGDARGDNAAAADSEDGITRAEFIRRANAICDTAVQDFNRKVSKGELEDIAEVAVATLENEVEQIESLGAPAGDAKQVEALVSDASEAIELLESGENRGDQVGTALRSAEKRAAGYGIDSCFLSS